MAVPQPDWNASEAAMTQPYRRWQVLPHGPLTRVSENMLTVVGQIGMPLLTLPRRMNVVRLRDSRLVVWSAIALDENEMEELEAFGRPTYLIVPNNHHRLDAWAWKMRYPHLIVVAPEGAREKVADIVSVDTTTPDFGDPTVQFVAVPGTRQREAALVVRNSDGTTLVLNDIVGNIRRASGLIGLWFLRAMRFAGDRAQIPRPVKWSLVEDAKALRAQLLQWAETDSLRRILVSHGDPIEANPRQTLRELAGSLA
jgi:hypothetical protein